MSAWEKEKVGPSKAPTGTKRKILPQNHPPRGGRIAHFKEELGFWGERIIWKKKGRRLIMNSNKKSFPGGLKKKSLYNG